MSVGSFLADPAFPQLKIATDPALMKETFRTHLRPVGGKVYDIEDCRFIRLRYRQDSRCFLLYTLRLMERDTDRERDVQVTGIIYAQKDKAEQTWRKLKATDPRQEIPDGLADLRTRLVCSRARHAGAGLPLRPSATDPARSGGGPTPRARACASWPVWSWRLARRGVERRADPVQGTGCCAALHGEMPETLRQGEQERGASTPRSTATKEGEQTLPSAARAAEPRTAPMEKASAW